MLSLEFCGTICNQKILDSDLLTLLLLQLSLLSLLTPVKFCNRSLIYAEPALWKELPKDLRQFAYHPISPVNLTSPPLTHSSAVCSFPLVTKNRTFQGILLLSRHTITISTISLCCLCGYCGLDLNSTSE